MRFLLVGSGRIDDYEYFRINKINYDYCISIDGGARHVIKLDIMPNLLIGDFDSVDNESLKHYEKFAIEKMTFSPDKDKQIQS
jgi:thiamine pyrophosphokinase